MGAMLNAWAKEHPRQNKCFDCRNEGITGMYLYPKDMGNKSGVRRCITTYGREEEEDNSLVALTAPTKKFPYLMVGCFVAGVAIVSIGVVAFKNKSAISNDIVII